MASLMLSRPPRPGAAAAVLGCVVLLTVPTVLAGCGGGDDGEEAATTSTTGATTTTEESTTTESTTTAPEDPYAVPARVDVAYVQLVARKLQELATSAYTSVRDDPTALNGAAKQLGAIYAPDVLGLISQDLANAAATDFRDFRPDPPVTVTQLVTTGPRCVAASGSAGPRAPAIYVVLVRLDAKSDPDGLNPTPWALRGFIPAQGSQATPKEQLCAT